MDPSLIQYFFFQMHFLSCRSHHHPVTDITSFHHQESSQDTFRDGSFHSLSFTYPPTIGVYGVSTLKLKPLCICESLKNFWLRLWLPVFYVHQLYHPVFGYWPGLCSLCEARIVNSFIFFSLSDFTTARCYSNKLACTPSKFADLLEIAFSIEKERPCTRQP